MPYKPLLDAGVKFYASLGNHDAREQRYYKLFNMDGKLYYSFKAPKQRRAVLRAREHLPRPDQIAWLEKELQELERGLEDRLLPPSALLVGRTARLDTAAARRARAAVREVQRQRRASPATITSTSASSRRRGSSTSSTGRAGSCGRATSTGAPGSPRAGFDSDQAFMVAEIDGDEMYFNAIVATGQVVDSGVITRRK